MVQGSPVEVAQKFFSLLERERWEEAAALVDQNWLVSFQEEQAPMLAAAGRSLAQPSYGAGRLSSAPSDSEAIRKTVAEFGNAPVSPLGRARTIAQLLALSANDFFARYLEVRAEVRAGANPPSLRTSWRVIGESLRNDSVAQIRYEYEGPVLTEHDRPGDMRTLIMHHQGGTWYCAPGQDLSEPWFGSLIEAREMMRRPSR